MLDCNQKYTQKITFFLKYLTAIADLYKSVKRVDPSCFIAVDNRDTVIQWLTDGELAASSSQREHQSPFQLSASLRSIDLDYHLQHLSSFFTAEKAATSYSLFVRGCRAQFTHLITNHHICCVQEGRVGTFFPPPYRACRYISKCLFKRLPSQSVQQSHQRWESHDYPCLIKCLIKVVFLIKKLIIMK